MNIISIFSGRKANIEILKKYLTKALELNIIHEVHFWNNTRNNSDDEYLKTISNLKRSSSAADGRYISIDPLIVNNSFELSVKAPNDIHIKLSNFYTEYEIVLGGWGNTKSVIRENNQEMQNLVQNNIADRNNHHTFQVSICNNNLTIFKNNNPIMSQPIQPNFEMKQISFKTGFNSVGDLCYTTTKNKGFYFMDTCEKSWKNYYNHYTDSKFNNDIIIKCDDDIVFIDLLKLPNFIDFVKNNEYDLVFANTINNGVAAYFQQNKYNLIPPELMTLEYPAGGFCGTLWENGKKAETLHNYFIENYKKFVNYPYDKEIILIHTRFSINFFGYKGKNWHKIKDCYGDDERTLTVDYVEGKNFNNVLYSDFFVSHLSFFRQIETGINSNDLVQKYDKFYNTIESEHFKI